MTDTRAGFDGIDGFDALDTVLCDLDGVVWLAHEPIPGSVGAIEQMRASGRRVLFVTNNSFARRAGHEAALARIGVDAAGDVVSSSMAAASLVEPGERALAVGGPGVAEALADRGVEVVLDTGEAVDGAVDAVVVGLDRHFDYDRLTVAADAVRTGARLIGTNADSTYPTPVGLLPGGGAILAAVAAASDGEPEIAGKPHRPMADLVTTILGGNDVAQFTLMVGDRLETDGLFAQRLGVRFALVRSGVCGPDDELDTSDTRFQPTLTIDLDVADLAAVARVLTNAGPLQQ